MNIAVSWKPAPWYSSYERGSISPKSGIHYIKRIYRHEHTGQILLYSDHDFDGKTLTVYSSGSWYGNPAPMRSVTMVKRGRFGKLYIEK